MIVASLLSLAIAAAPVCVEQKQAEQLWDLSQRLDKKLDICNVDLSAARAKLIVATATVVHTNTIIQSRDFTLLEDIVQVLGVVAVFGLGFGTGYLFFH
jgi:hypothetical protein